MHRIELFCCFSSNIEHESELVNFEDAVNLFSNHYDKNTYIMKKLLKSTKQIFCIEAKDTLIKEGEEKPKKTKKSKKPKKTKKTDKKKQTKKSKGKKGKKNELSTGLEKKIYIAIGDRV